MFEYYNKQECIDYIRVLKLESFNLLDYLHSKSYQIVRRQVYIYMLWYRIYKINGEKYFNKLKI